MQTSLYKKESIVLLTSKISNSDFSNTILTASFFKKILLFLLVIYLPTCVFGRIDATSTNTPSFFSKNINTYSKAVIGDIIEKLELSEEVSKQISSLRAQNRSTSSEAKIIGDYLVHEYGPYKSATTLKMEESEIIMSGWYFNNNNYTGSMGNGASGIVADATGTCVSTSNMNRQSGTNSTTDGNTGRAICVGAFGVNNSWVDNDPRAIRFTLTYPADKSGHLSKLEFYQQSPLTNHWYPEDIDVCNNPAQKFGFRVLKDGNEIYESIDHLSSATWQFESFDFTGDSDFEFTNGATFLFEILAYDKNDLNCYNNIIGTEPVMWDLDDVEVLGYCTSATGCDNKISNEEFDNGTNDWLLNVDGSTAAGAVWNIDNSNQLSGTNSVFVNVTNATSLPWNIQLLQENKSIIAGTEYQVVFEGRATAERDMLVAVQRNSGTWDTYGSQTVNLTTEPQTYSFKFIAPETNIGGAALIFHLATSTDNVYIDNVRFSEVCVTEICDNNIDDDGDGLIDNADDDCSTAVACTSCTGNNLFDNPSFETGTWSGSETFVTGVFATNLTNNPSSPLDSWGYDNAKWVESNKATDGNRFVYLNNDTDESVCFSQLYTFGNGNEINDCDTYQVCFDWASFNSDFVNGRTTYSQPSIDFIFRDNAGQKIKFISIPLGETTANQNWNSLIWQSLSFSFKFEGNLTVPANTSEIKVLISERDGYNNGLLLDNTSLCLVNSCSDNCKFITSSENPTTSSWIGGGGDWIQHDVDNDMQLYHNSDGTMTIQGNVIDGTTEGGTPCGDNDGWFIDLTLSNKKDWATWNGNYDTHNVDNGICSDNHTTFDYWDVIGTLTGTGCNAGKVYPITGNKEGYQVQVGYGASRSTCDFGMAGWTVFDENGTEKVFDIYFLLDESCYNKPNSCAPQFNNIVVSNCINQPLMDVVTVDATISWTTAPANDIIEVSIDNKTEYIDVAGGVTSPQTIRFIVPADGSNGNTITVNWKNTAGCNQSLTYDAPSACSSNEITCDILYICGDDKPYDGDSWDHGWIEYLDAVNGNKGITAAFSKPDASGMGLYDPNNINNLLSIDFNDYDLIIVSATTEDRLSNDIINSLATTAVSVLNSNYTIVDDLGMSNSNANYTHQNFAHTDATTSETIYNFNNQYPSNNPALLRGNYLSNADVLLWRNGADYSSDINGALFYYTSDDVLTGIANHGDRLFLGYHMNGVYANAENGGAIPTPDSLWFDPVKHLTLVGKNYFDTALLIATSSCSDVTTNTCSLTNPYPGFPIDFLNDNSGWSDYDLGSDLVIIDNGNGTKTISGSIDNGTPVDFGSGINGTSCGVTDGWNMTLVLSDKMDWTTFQAAGGSANVHANCNAQIADLDYWDVSGTLTGIGCNTGRTLTINGPKAPYRLQIGYGGNNGDAACDFGMSTWFDIEENGSTINADIYAFLNESCYNTTYSNKDVCYLISDGEGDGYLTADTFYTFNHTTGAVVAVGETGTLNIEAMAYDTVNQIIYAADDDDFGTINIATGVFTAITTDMGSLNGAAGNDNINGLDGMTYDYVNNLIWATERASGTDGLPDDMLLKIDPATGMPLPNGFGAGIGYLVIATNEHDLDDIAMAADGTLYAISNFGGSGNQRLGTINTTTGVFTEIGDYGIEDVESLTFTATGQLIATTGEDGRQKNSLFSIDAATAVATFIGSIEPGHDVEACVCSFGNLSNLQIGDKVWADLNNDGLQDVDEPGLKNVKVNLLDENGNAFLDNANNPMTTITDIHGIYNFAGLAAGNYIVEFELPTGTSFATKDAGGDDTKDSDADGTTGRTGIITVSGSINNLDADAGILNANVVVRDCTNDGELFVLDEAGGVLLRYNSMTGVLIDTFIQGFIQPMEMIVGNDDFLYISDRGLQEIRRYSLITGALIDVLARNLNAPVGMTFGADGMLYVNHKNRDEVLKIDPSDGTISTFITGQLGGLDGNYGGIEFGPDGDLYVTSRNTDEILRYNGTTGAFIGAFVTAGSGTLNGPDNLTFGSDGDLYVTSSYSDQVKRYNGTTGAFISDFVTYRSGGLRRPLNVVFGSDGNVYVSGQDSPEGVYRYNESTGAFVDLFATGIDEPRGVLFAPVPNCDNTTCCSQINYANNSLENGNFSSFTSNSNPDGTATLTTFGGSDAIDWDPSGGYGTNGSPITDFGANPGYWVDASTNGGSGSLDGNRFYWLEPRTGVSGSDCIGAVAGSDLLGSFCQGDTVEICGYVASYDPNNINSGAASTDFKFEIYTNNGNDPVDFINTPTGTSSVNDNGGNNESFTLPLPASTNLLDITGATFTGANGQVADWRTLNWQSVCFQVILKEEQSNYTSIAFSMGDNSAGMAVDNLSIRDITTPDAGKDTTYYNCSGTIDLNDAQTGQIWSKVTEPNGATATIDATTGVVTGLTENGDYKFLLARSSDQTCHDTIRVVVKCIPEICDNSIDDDGNGLIDQFDPACPCAAGISNINFDVDANGNNILAGANPAELWAAWGVHITSEDPINNPLMIFDSNNPSAADRDLGTPNEDFGGTGIGKGGETGKLGENSKSLGNLLIISEDGNASVPNDKASGGIVTFTFDAEVSIAALEILDLDYALTKGVIRIYNSANNLITEKKVLAYGNNSYQKIAINVSGIRRMEVDISNSFSIGSLLFCDEDLPLGSIGDFVWDDVNGDGSPVGEVGLESVKVFLLDPLGDTYILAETVTDNTGYYSFSGLPDGDYRVKIQAPTGYSGTFDLNGGNDNDSGTFSISNGAMRTDIDFGLNFTGSICDGNGIEAEGESRYGYATNAIGTPDGITTRLNAGSDYLTITLKDELPIGTTYNIHMSGVGQDVPINIFEGPEGIDIPNSRALSPAGFTQNGQATGLNNSITSVTKTASVNTKYLYFVNDPGLGNVQIDAITYTLSCIEICNDNIDNDNDGLTDCEDPDCHTINITNLSFSECVAVGNEYHATLTMVVEWTNPPAGEGIDVVLPYNSQFIDIVGGATSPYTIQFVIDADNSANQFSLAYSGGSSCSFDSYYESPAPCPPPTDRDKPCNNATGHVGGIVFEDLNGDGLQDSGEPGIAGILVMATDSTAATVGRTTTNNLGVFEFTDLTDGERLRIEFTAIPSGMYPTNGSTYKGTTVQFVEAPTCATTLGLINPTDNPCTSGTTSILQNGHSIVGCLPAGDNVTLAIKDVTQLGTLWQTPANRNNNQSANVSTIQMWETSDFEGEEIFSMAVDSRDGTIYAIASPLYSPDPQVAGVLFEETVSPKVFKINGKTGNVTRIAELNGSLGLGYVDFDLVNEQLFISNMDDGKIYRLNTDGAVLGSFDPLVADDGIKGQLPILGDRILGVAFNPIDKRVYYAVWANHTTSTSGYFRVNNDYNSIRSIALDANGDFLPATDQLEFNVPYAYSVDNYTSPVGDIAFNRAGDRLLVAETPLYEINATGQISTTAHLATLREFSKTSGSWVIEPTYGSNSEGKYDIGSQLFYKGRNSRGGVDWAFESISGNTINGDDDYILAVGDAIHIQGADGDDIYGYQFTPATGGNITNSVLVDLDDDTANPYKYVYGDVDVYKSYCATLSLEIGNYVWLDIDEDGIQDPNENGIPNVNVTLYSAVGDSLTTVVTNNDGEYYFSEYTAGFSGLMPNTTYYVTVGKGGQFNTTNATLNNNYGITLSNTGTGSYSDWNDSDALIGNTGNGHPAFVDGYPFIEITTGTMGQNDHSFDFGFAELCSVTNAVNDSLNLCPGLDFSGSVAQNDSNLENKIFSLLTPPTHGTVTVDTNGAFDYVSTNTLCGTDQFTYQVCDPANICCTSAVVHLSFEDTTKPTLLNVPADDTISCDEELPLPPQIFALDNCPQIALNVKEESTQGEDGCSLYDYTITRTWTATDQCGNSTSDSQIVDVQDVVAPDIYRIYTLPNGKKMVAGVMEFVGKNWKTVNLPIDFETQPIILHQVVTTNDITPVVSQIRNTSVSQFELRIQEEENEDNIHTRESVAWIAMEGGLQGSIYQLEMASLFLSDASTNVSFLNAFTTAPALFTSTQTTNEVDPFSIRHNNLTATGMSLAIQEESSKDAEIAHANEKIGYLAIEKVGDLREERGILMGEVGTTALSNTWTTINLNNTYHNPVIIANSLSMVDGEAATVRIRNVGLTSFEVRVEEWDYLDGNHGNETVNYIVIEGSIPLESPSYCDTGTDSLDIGIDFKSVDNCDVSVVINYSETFVFEGAKKIIQRTWAAEDECGNSNSYTQEITCEGVSLRVKSVLQGAMLGNYTEGLMRDDLRKKGLLPYEEPYSKMSRFKHVQGGGGEVADSSVFQIEGANGIVDWVFLELRDPNDVQNVLATMSALIQCDGDVVSAQGDSILHFKNTPIGDYFVAIRHRNHLGTVGSNTYTFSQNQVPFVDFTYNFTPVAGSNPSVEIDNLESLWSGDLNNDGKVIYQGPNNDIFYMFLHILQEEANTEFLPNYISRGYTPNDFNMDGTVIFQGPNNDRANLLFSTILSHPLNTQRFSNFIIFIGN